MTTVFDFLRHGTPVGGRRYRGQIDDPLSEIGWAQMRAATSGERPWQAIVASPLARCAAFAEWLAQDASLPLSFDDRLKEVGFGVWEGKTAAEIEQDAPGRLFDFKCDPVGRRPEGAEPLADFHARVGAAYADLVAAHQSRHVLVVAHAGVMRMVMCHVLGLDPAHAYRIDIASAGMLRIKIEQHGAARLDKLLWLSAGC